tara:strand:+ start:1664 stop:1924 length:261 start_codon:yes stop_codon:yes gene_type:complete
MSLYQRHIKSQSTINYEEPYAFSKPTTAAFISTETMETNAEKKSVRQTSQNVHAKPGLAENKKAEGQAETTCFAETMESKTVGIFT